MAVITLGNRGGPWKGPLDMAARDVYRAWLVLRLADRVLSRSDADVGVGTAEMIERQSSADERAVVNRSMSLYTTHAQYLNCPPPGCEAHAWTAFFDNLHHDGQACGRYGCDRRDGHRGECWRIDSAHHAASIEAYDYPGGIHSCRYWEGDRHGGCCSGRAGPMVRAMWRDRPCTAHRHGRCALSEGHCGPHVTGDRVSVRYRTEYHGEHVMALVPAAALPDWLDTHTHAVYCVDHYAAPGEVRWYSDHSPHKWFDRV